MPMDWGWIYDGVNASIPRNRGPDCAEYLTGKRQLIESIFVCAIGLWLLKLGITNSRQLESVFHQKYHTISSSRQLLLVAMTFSLGLELGFKFSSRTVIYILNPCHITSIIQIYLLSAKPSKSTTALFRIHLNFLNGPLLAYLFPEIESRRIPMEAINYYLQHGLMFIIPIVLLRQGGAYNMEHLLDFSWNAIGYAILLLYHFSFLEMFAIPFQINLNHMLCPAILDPFEGANYRLYACVHQAILCPFLCKFYCILFRPSITKLTFNVNIIKNNEIPQQLPDTILEELKQTKHLTNDNGCDDNQIKVDKTTPLILDKENAVKKIE